MWERSDYSLYSSETGMEIILKVACKTQLVAGDYKPLYR